MLGRVLWTPIFEPLSNRSDDPIMAQIDPDFALAMTRKLTLG
ncbi:MAG TPA: hypothetical protein VG326_08485 [Tepidisphaeraceae bacterium]|nr:hypothetical protein [Tepidisphaeraceae bacterium]